MLARQFGADVVLNMRQGDVVGEINGRFPFIYITRLFLGQFP